MKQRILNMLVALTAMAGSASAQTLSIAPIEAEAGAQAELVVTGASIGNAVTALQFNLSLPEGITLDEAAITKGAAASGHELSVSTLDSGERLFVLYNMSLDAIGNGELLRLPITIGQNATSGNAQLSTVRFASTEAVSTAGSNVSAAINVTTDDELLRYDVNRDGIMDTILLSVADTASDDGWWPCSGQYRGSKRFDGIQPGNIILGNTAPSDKIEYNSTWIHELGHAMGLPDYYKYVNTENGTFGLNGEAGWELMDDAYGDLSAFSKLMLGWCTEPAVQIYTGGTQTFEIPCGQTAPGCVIIPRRDPDDRLNEYFVLEYVTNTGNNQAHFQQIRPISMFTEGGLRVTHAESTVSIGLLDTPEFKWNNYGKNYDKSNEKQRVLRLVNEAEGGSFFRPGDVLTDSLSGFRWYDENGDQTVPAGCTVTVKSIENDICTVEIAEAST